MKIHPPSKNLGCLGFRICKRLYFDFYRSPHLGMFINLVGRRIWIHRNGFKAELKHTDIIFRLVLEKQLLISKHLTCR
jgi:hypothetical protein